MKNKIQLSIIIVNYRVEKETIACVFSIIKSGTKVIFEIIVVDNDFKNGLKEALVNIPQVKYVRSGRNIGFGAGNNLGVMHSTGDLLFFLNPDTLVEEGSIDTLFKFVKHNFKAGMVAPLLLDPSGQVYSNQGSDKYSFINAIVTSSFVNKFFPNNPVSSKFFHRDWDRKIAEEFDVVPGTAFMIHKELFKKVGMFDERLFLYFEEYDLARRVKDLGYKNYIIPKSKVMHIWGVSTKKEKNIDQIFSENRYYFFKKNYGIFIASIIDIISKVGKYEFMLFLTLGISIFLNIFKLGELMTFIGDQGWFYLSARDMLVNGQIPLVGIASSHPWLHQGPLWTYIVATLFWIFGFNPLVPGYFTAIVGSVMVLLMYKIGSVMFSRRIGLIASFLYATSPLIISNNRMPYHTSLIPFFTLLFIYSIYRWLRGNIYFFPLTLFFLTILYNFEISTAPLWIPFMLILVYGSWKKAKWVKKMKDIKIAAFSLIGLLIPMIPMIVYDATHRFPQTLKFVLWVGYRVARIFGFPNIHGDQQFPSTIPFVPFSLSQLQQLVFLPSLFLSSILLLMSLSVLTYLILSQIKKMNGNVAYIIVYLAFAISVVGYLGVGTASGAYFPLIFSLIMFILAIGLDYLLNFKKIYLIGLVLIFFIVFFNGYSFLRTLSVKNSCDLTFSERIIAAKKIIQMSGGREYNLIGKGPGSQFESFTMNYEYLTWKLGYGPSKNDAKLEIFVSESLNGIKIEK